MDSWYWMAPINIVADELERFSVCTFSAKEITFNILGLMHPFLSSTVPSSTRKLAFIAPSRDKAADYMTLKLNICCNLLTSCLMLTLLRISEPRRLYSGSKW